MNMMFWVESRKKNFFMTPGGLSRSILCGISSFSSKKSTIFAFSRPRTRPWFFFNNMASKPIHLWRNWHQVGLNPSINEWLSKVFVGTYAGPRLRHLPVAISGKAEFPGWKNFCPLCHECALKYTCFCEFWQNFKEFGYNWRFGGQISRWSSSWPGIAWSSGAAVKWQNLQWMWT